QRSGCSERFIGLSSNTKAPTAFLKPTFKNECSSLVPEFLKQKVGYDGRSNPRSKRAAGTARSSRTNRSTGLGHGRGGCAAQEAAQAEDSGGAQGENAARKKDTAPHARALGCLRRGDETSRDLRL